MSKLSRIWRSFLQRNFLRGEKPASLNQWQQAFCEWNAERLGIPPVESVDRFKQSCAALKGGHGGRAFKLYGEIQHELLRPFASNRADEIVDAYKTHAQVHFLRMLSYPLPAWPDHIPELAPLFEKRALTIVDFGCGLAQTSISLAQFLQGRGRTLELFLVDLPVPQLEFLRWLCRRLKLPATIAECTPTAMLPPLPACDLLIATELFEHLHEPLGHLKAFTTAVRPGGFLLTNIADHESEFLHVTPKLAPLREFLRQHGWPELRPSRIYQKP